MSPGTRPRHPYLDWGGPIAFAHRGGASGAPENTLPAFQRAVDLGYHYLETDVHVTADGVVVAFHDDDLSRACGLPGRISELPASAVAAARVDGTATIPTLDQLLEEFPDVRFNIDCKSDAAIEPLADAVVAHGALHRVCLASFKDRRVRALRRRLGSDVCTSAGTWELALLWGTGLSLGAMAAQVPVQRGRFTVVDERFVRRAHRRHVAVHVWTIDDDAEMNRLLDIGVDGIMTDQPAVLRDVLIARGAWAV